MEFYCEPCETAMCRECTAGEHREHRTVPLRDVLEQHKAALQQQLDAVRSRYAAGPRGAPRARPAPTRVPRRLPQLAAAVALVSEISRQLGERKDEAVAEIGSTFEELEAALRQRRGLLVRDLEAACAAKQKVTAPRRGSRVPVSPCTMSHATTPACCRARCSPAGSDGAGLDSWGQGPVPGVRVPSQP